MSADPDMRQGAKIVGCVGIVIAAIAVAKPAAMLELWPARVDAAAALIRGWGISTAGLCAVLLGLDARTAVQLVCIASVPWDLDWGGAMGRLAAALNMACAVSLHETY